MRSPARVQSRKLLVASIGVASMTYVATTTLLPACSSSSTAGSSSKTDSGSADTGSGVDAIDDFPVANLAVPVDSQAPQDSSPSDVLQIDDFPVANLAVMPDAGMPDVGGG